MECPFNTPLSTPELPNSVGEFWIYDVNRRALFNVDTKEQADFLVIAINCHEKLVKLILKVGKADHFIGAIYSGMPTSSKVEKLLEKAMEELKPIRRYVYDLEQALKETGQNRK